MFTQQKNIYMSNVGTAAQDLMGYVCTPAQLLPMPTQKNNTEVANLHTAARYLSGQSSHSSMIFKWPIFTQQHNI